MRISKKLVISIGWIALFAATSYAFQGLRRIGTNWTDNAGFFRLIGLLLFGLAFIFAPLVLAALTWFGQPKGLYKRLG